MRGRCPFTPRMGGTSGPAFAVEALKRIQVGALMLSCPVALGTLCLGCLPDREIRWGEKSKLVERLGEMSRKDYDVMTQHYYAPFPYFLIALCAFLFPLLITV